MCVKIVWFLSKRGTEIRRKSVCTLCMKNHDHLGTKGNGVVGLFDQNYFYFGYYILSVYFYVIKKSENLLLENWVSFVTDGA